MRVLLRKFTILLVTVLLLHNVLSGPAYAADYGTLLKETSKTVSPEVEHIQRSYINGKVNRFVNILDIDLSNPYTSIEMGLPNPINKLTRTSVIAQNNSYEGHRVVGAINAAYFNSNGYPSTLIALNNEILNFGAIGTNYESPTQKPVAFGISKNGTAIADYYTTNFTYAINGQTYKLNSINELRYADTAVVYTEKNKTTGTNEWGREIIVENASQSTKNLGFGDVVTGTIKEITGTYGKGDNEIPENGFVISATGTAISKAFDTAKVGDEVTITIGIDEKWQDADFIMAAGPLLVNNGKVELSMPNDASFAASRHPRTAVGIDATGQNVFFVTVDGRQTGHSLGSNLKDLGEYMISLGANYAINLDGGGSTTMVVREIGTNTPKLVNKPSNGSEIGVSAILQVINSAPAGTAKVIIPNQKNYDLFIGDTVTPTIKAGYDDYLNPLTITQSDILWSVKGDIGYFDGSKFIATTTGTGSLVATVGNATVTIPVSVAKPIIEPIAIHSFDSNSNLTVQAAKATASLSNDSTYTREGKGSVALTYDFKTNEEGTKAAYVIANNPISIASRPDHLGIWVYGDGNKNWLRGVVVDAAGTKHTIDFTKQSGLNWTGWKYVTAKMPVEGVAPFTFDRLYIASPVASEWAKGKIYFDKLQAVYNKEHVELKYTDVAPNYWAFSTIERLNTLGLIKGYVDGTFKPTNEITRGEAAMILSREMQVEVNEVIHYEDVAPNYYAFDAIQEVAAAGIITGRVAGKFNPTSPLTRAEMAAIIDRMYKLTGTAVMNFSDVAPNHWAYDSIMRLYKNELITGYTDGTFKPNAFITRAEFANILSKAIK